MSYTPAPLLANAMTLPIISTASDWSVGGVVRLMGGGSLASSTMVANRAYYMPLHLPATVSAKRMCYCVGTVGGTDTIQLGIYDEAGNRIVASTAATVGTAANFVFQDITDTVLQPGSYYLACVLNGTTATILRWGLTTTPAGQLACLQQATAAPLPNPATFAASNDNVIPYIGIATTASP